MVVVVDAIQCGNKSRRHSILRGKNINIQCKSKIDLHFKFTHLKKIILSNQMVRPQMSGVLNLNSYILDCGLDLQMSILCPLGSLVLQIMLGEGKS